MYDYILVLSDKDDHTNPDQTYNALCSIGKTYNSSSSDGREKVVVGYSNPCFEFWLLLHQSYRDTGMRTASVCSEFKKKLGKDYKTDTALFQHFDDSWKQALEHANRLEQHWQNHKKTSFAERNPSTNIHKIIDKLLELDQQ